MNQGTPSYGCIFNHTRMKMSRFTCKNLTPLLTNIQKKNYVCWWVISIKSLKCKNKHQYISEFYNNMSSHFFAPYILQPTGLTKNSKTLIGNIFLNSTGFKTFSINLISLISDHPAQLLILKDFITNLL